MNKWTLVFDEAAIQQLLKLDPSVRKRIVDYLENDVISSQTPLSFGKPLSGKLANLWRYRVGSYRIICLLEKKIFNVRVVKVGHRRDVYK